METTRRDFESQLAFGEEGEHEIAAELLRRGIAVQPLYQYQNTKDGNSPKIMNANRSIVAPDLSCYKRGVAFFVEVKTKRQWVEWNGVKETGLNARLYDQYKDVKKATGLNVWIIFNHIIQDPGRYYCEIDTPFRRWDGRSIKTGKRIEDPLVLFSRNNLRRL